MFIHFSYYNLFHMIFSFCFNNGMRKIKRNSRTRNFSSVDAVTADFRGSINQCFNLAACLNKLETDNKADLSCSHHNDFLPRLTSVAVTELGADA